ncbi:hypothetical protein B566_EDAN018172 [Ephemera danica]|nr:hypothetical protein B566_EDAN018172 [Ephemera danica]
MAYSIQGYEMEPEFTPTEMQNWRKREEEAQRKIAGRAGNNIWCKCGHCRSMPDDIQSVCCHENEKISPIRAQLSCISLHPAFTNIILNEDSLMLSRHKMLSFEKNYVNIEKLKNVVAADSWRYIAYRDFVLWINSKKRLGKNVRVPLPSCVVWAVRSKWPEASEQYVGFKLSEIDIDFSV